MEDIIGVFVGIGNDFFSFFAGIGDDFLRLFFGISDDFRFFCFRFLFFRCFGE